MPVNLEGRTDIGRKSKTRRENEMRGRRLIAFVDRLAGIIKLCFLTFSSCNQFRTYLQATHLTQ